MAEPEVYTRITRFTPANSGGAGDKQREAMNEAWNDLRREWINNVAVNNGGPPMPADLAAVEARMESVILASTQPGMSGRQVMGLVRHNFAIEG